ncbi:MAG: hypothetical protein Q8J62_10625 [Candidatus Cloacimonadaceae bacterium]|nr:hypothetical protein [Candidatus Cloacimonadaceae bacterium]
MDNLLSNAILVKDYFTKANEKGGRTEYGITDVPVGSCAATPSGATQDSTG